MFLNPHQPQIITQSLQSSSSSDKQEHCHGRPLFRWTNHHSYTLFSEVLVMEDVANCGKNSINTEKLGKCIEGKIGIWKF